MIPLFAKSDTLNNITLKAKDYLTSESPSDFV